MTGICGHQYNTDDETITTLCPDCEARLYGPLPKLLGSEKEVSLASQIRINVLRAIAKIMVNKHQELHRTMQISRLMNKQKSRWWIEHLNYSTDDIMIALM